MKLLIVTTEFPPGPGGIGNHAYELANNLFKSNVTVRVICPLQYVSSDVAVDFDRKQKFEIARMPRGNNFFLKVYRRIIFLIANCNDFKPKIIVASNGRAVLYGLVVSSILSIPYIAVGHGAEFARGFSFYSLLKKYAFNRAKKVICVSNFTTGLAVKFRVRPEKIKTIYNGSDEKKFFPENGLGSFKRKIGLEGKKIILSVGQVSERKAQDTVIRSMPSILEKCPEAIYVIVGLPTKAEEYKKLAKKLGVKDYVRFEGIVGLEILRKYYNICDVCLLNSRIAQDGENEGFGLVLIEAGLCAKPVIGTRNCGIEEVIVNNETGLIIDADSTYETASAVTYILNNKEKAIELGLAGRDRALKNFTSKMCTEKYFDVISKTYL